jgi:hypothetical protein
MTLHVPRLPVSLDPLIAEAKRRARQRRVVIAAVLLAAGLGAGLTLALRSSPGGPGSGGPSGAAAGAVARVSNRGIGGVRIGATKAQTVATLSRLFGPPSRRFVSDGCGSPTVTEVAWGNLYAEFRNDTFSGYRYLSGTWLRTGVYPSRNLSSVQPRLATAAGITIGDSLQQLRRAEGTLTPVGTARWQDGAGLVFYDNATRFPDPASSRITEIKYATCGDF